MKRAEMAAEIERLRDQVQLLTDANRRLIQTNQGLARKVQGFNLWPYGVSWPLDSWWYQDRTSGKDWAAPQITWGSTTAPNLDTEDAAGIEIRPYAYWGADPVPPHPPIRPVWPPDSGLHRRIG